MAKKLCAAKTQICKLFIWTTKCGRATLRNIVTAGIIIRTQETRNAASRGQFLLQILLQTELNNCFFSRARYCLHICTIFVKLPISGGFLTGQDGICRIVFNNLLDHNLSWQQWQMWPQLQNADPEIRHELRNLRQYFLWCFLKVFFFQISDLSGIAQFQAVFFPVADIFFSFGAFSQHSSVPTKTYFCAKCFLILFSFEREDWFEPGRLFLGK